MPIKDGNVATAEIRDLQDAGEAGYSPILGVSANVREAQTKSMMDAGMDAVISKPFKVEDLVTKIRSLLPRGGNGKGKEKKDKERKDKGKDKDKEKGKGKENEKERGNG